MFCLTGAKIGNYADIEKFLGDFYRFLRNEKVRFVIPDFLSIMTKYIIHSDFSVSVLAF